MTPEERDDFMHFFNRTGRFANSWWAGSLWTYPDATDEEQQAKHKALEELESHGLVVRHHVGDGFVVWKSATTRKESK